MSQRETLQAVDEIFAEAFLSAGMADSGTYQPAHGGDSTPCQLLIDRNAQFFGESGDVAGTRITIALLLSEVASPSRNATVTVGSEVFTLQQMVERDESRQVWVVENE